MDAAALAGAVSGAEDLLSRLIGMRLPGVLAGLLDGAYSWDEEGLTSLSLSMLERQFPSFFFTLWASLEVSGDCSPMETRPKFT